MIGIEMEGKYYLHFTKCTDNIALLIFLMLAIWGVMKMHLSVNFTEIFKMGICVLREKTWILATACCFLTFGFIYTHTNTDAYVHTLYFYTEHTGMWKNSDKMHLPLHFWETCFRFLFLLAHMTPTF